MQAALAEPETLTRTGQPVSEQEALQKGMEEKSKEFVSKGAEVYTSA